MFKCPCKIAAFLFKLQVLPRGGQGHHRLALAQDSFTQYDCLQRRAPYSDVKFLPASNWGENPFHSGMVLLFGSWGFLVFPWGLDHFLISHHLPVPVTKDLLPGFLSFLLKDSLGFVEWSREDCIVGAGLGEHTFSPQTSPSYRKPNKIYTYNFFLSPESRFERKSMCASGN